MRGQDDAPDAMVVFVVRRGEGLAAIDRDLMSAIGKLRADFFGKLLEAAVAIGDAARTDDGNLHGRPSALAATRRERTAATTDELGCQRQSRAENR